MANNSGVFPAEDLERADREAMEKHGITSVSKTTYLVGPYRYSKLADAIAEAKRRVALS